MEGSVDFHARSSRAREWAQYAGLAAVSVALSGLALVRPPGWHAVAVALALVCVAATWLRPVAGTALLLCSALLFEQYRFAPFRTATQDIPFFERLSATTGVGPLVVSPFELALICVGLIVIVRSVVRHLRWRDERTLAPLMLFAGSLVLWLGYGLLNGGSASVGVAEVRAPAYFVAMLLLTAHTVTGEKDAALLLTAGFGVVVVKALQALSAYLFVLRGDLRGVESITAHEDALFIAFAMVLLAVSLFYRAMPRLRLILVAALPLFAWVFAATERRAAYVALAVGLSVLFLLLLTDPSKRSRALGAAVPVALAVSVALASGWNGRGVFGGPVQSLRSILQPQLTEDVQSNYYRRAEEMNLVIAIRENPVAGLGFGRPFQRAGQLSTIGFEYADSIPHNQILGLWAKTGTVGFSLFWALAGGLIAFGVVAFKKARRDGTRIVAALATCALVMQLVVSYVDMQLTFARNMTFLGVLIGLLLAVERDEEGGGAPERA